MVDIEDLALSMVEILRHPFVLAVTTALITGWIVNGLTRRWQDRQKALEIRTELVSAMSESVIKAILAVDRAASQVGRERLAKEPGISPTPSAEQVDDSFAEELRQSRSAWELESNVIGTKLEAYFPSQSRRHSEGSLTPAAWSDHARKLARWLADDRQRETWRDERTAILEGKGRLIQRVLREPLAGYHDA